jgi:hypothetical protein
MSRYEWEEGTIILPSAEYADVKREVRSAYNKMMNTLYTVGGKMWEAIREDGASFQEAYKRFAAPKTIDADLANPLPEQYQTEWLLKRAMYRKDHDRALKPRRKDLPRKTNRDVDYTPPISEWSLRFNNDSRKVLWHVPENNHACEHAHRHPVPQAFFRRMNRVDWTRSSGGKIVGNDEYNRAHRDAGAGANYVKKVYGDDEEAEMGLKVL